VSLILGIDAAWTKAGSSGVALLKVAGGKPRLIAAAPSYAGFISLAEQHPAANWFRSLGGGPPVPQLLKAGERLGGAAIDVVSIDMPVALTEITGRRVADNKISQQFGAACAGTHSVSRSRPGPFGKAIAQAFLEAGYPLTTNSYFTGKPVLIEVFPLAALVRLMGLKKRPPYKVTKTAKYWRGAAREKRRELLIHEWSCILAALKTQISAMSLTLPLQWSTWSELKPYEDALDSIISGCRRLLS
jgi:predicted RNase H-like nuclease